MAKRISKDVSNFMRDRPRKNPNWPMSIIKSKNPSSPFFDLQRGMRQIAHSYSRCASATFERRIKFSRMHLRSRIFYAIFVFVRGFYPTRMAHVARSVVVMMLEHDNRQNTVEPRWLLKNKNWRKIIFSRQNHTFLGLCCLSIYFLIYSELLYCNNLEVIN